MIKSNGRRVLLVCTAVTICAGLGLRRYGYDLGLPFLIVKYGGSMLWAAMVYFLVSVALVEFSERVSLALALTIAVFIELFRLYHTPWLDAFRLTTIGALLVGRVFSVWNMVAYACGILAAYGVFRALCGDRRGDLPVRED